MQPTPAQSATEARLERDTAEAADKHTPGPWTTNGNGCVVGKDGTLVATVPRPKGAGASAKKAANADLIAAAPQLLAACERMSLLIDKLMPSVPWGSTWNTSDWAPLLNEAPAEARAAVLAARGGAK